MKAVFLFITLYAIGFADLFGQTLSKNYVDKWIVETFSTTEIDSNALYILNGFPIDTDSIENKLSSYLQSDLILIDYLDKATTENMVFCTPARGIVLLTTKGNQNKKIIRKNFSKAVNQFSNSYSNLGTSEELPVLIINGHQVKSSESTSVLKSLRKADVLGINIIGRPVSKQLYGENGKNGLVVISAK
ncbi:hypothetical protein [Adhaeribacter rhizoryzae]|uniref:TonB-dependent receptor plug domain-containing protein n=1 Tax=Adhaeribacter rhizoryzae TaxID=2607907 RepID=A0A5M6CYY7_9BACT|nr:hypothetical protein [Adhaeribacter rhizoryzae]KAA5539640.1 hypothetical protein F0145_23935 [Adhaeribacter rhizoryzae]